MTAVEEARWTASRWPPDKRRKTESFTVHQVLARIDDDAERFATIDVHRNAPPQHCGSPSTRDRCRRVRRCAVTNSGAVDR
ncbi:DUF6192 family protein [Streptomyces sp. NPDC005046]